MNVDHSQYCHCVCTDIEVIMDAINDARAIHIQYLPREKPCIMCNTFDGTCDNCKWIKDCIVCGEAWPCDTIQALDYEDLLPELRMGENNG